MRFGFATSAPAIGFARGFMGFGYDLGMNISSNQWIYKGFHEIWATGFSDGIGKRNKGFVFVFGFCIFGRWDL